ncbi:MAG: hypothetical protein IPM35_11610 [Myxococcales bacterium]|nr:hypothetical protein [Myxococcales bacterium]
MAKVRARPSAPFVVTVVLTAVAGACGGSTTNGSGGSGGSGGAPGGGGCGANPPSIPCPPTPPAEGSLCPNSPSSCFGGGWWGSSCTYSDPCGGNTPLVLDCGGSTTWKVTSGVTTCQSCPPTEPGAGTPCALVDGQICSFANGCCDAAYQCSQGTWQEVPVSCNPPPLVCPASPPDPNAPCDPCALGGECTYDTCASLGKTTKASCVSGGWSVTVEPCLVDAGTD